LHPVAFRVVGMHGPETVPLPEEVGKVLGVLGQPFASNPLRPAYMSPPQNSGVLAIALDASLQAGGTGLALHCTAAYALKVEAGHMEAPTTVTPMGAKV
jgi:hypothetical protein